MGLARILFKTTAFKINNAEKTLREKSENIPKQPPKQMITHIHLKDRKEVCVRQPATS